MMNTIKNMPSNARVWVYQCSRELSVVEVNALKVEGEKFISDWNAHGAVLNASFDILYDLFVVIAVDEEQAMASGCSIDKSVHFVKNLETTFNIELLNRMQVAYKSGDEILMCSLNEFETLAETGLVNENTIVFNNTVTSKEMFDAEWEVPLKKSWQNRVLSRKDAFGIK